MKGIDYHGALGPLADACAMAQADMAFVLNPLQGFKLPCLPSQNLLARAFWKAGIFIRHVLLVGRLWFLSPHRVILVREFSSLPLLAVCGVLFPLRKKLVFTINHNLQWAVRSCTEAFALRMLDRFGFRFMFFETKDIDGTARLGLNPNHHWVVPHPVVQQENQQSSDAPFTVGIVGHYRPEKGIDDVLDVLLSSAPSFRLVVGIPNLKDFTRNSRYGKGHSEFDLRDTSMPEIYLSTLTECSVVLLCYPSEGYMFRASGIIADAAACNVAILAPRFPLLERQVRFPNPIGECYAAVEEIPEYIDRMEGNMERYQASFETYTQSRTAEALAKLFDEQIASMDS